MAVWMERSAKEKTAQEYNEPAAIDAAQCAQWVVKVSDGLIWNELGCGLRVLTPLCIIRLAEDCAFHQERSLKEDISLSPILVLTTRLTAVIFLSICFRSCLIHSHLDSQDLLERWNCDE